MWASYLLDLIEITPVENYDSELQTFNYIKVCEVWISELCGLLADSVNQTLVCVDW